MTYHALLLTILSPSGKSIADEIIALVHLPSVDPNFLSLAARDEAELKQKASGPAGTIVKDRKTNLVKYIEEAKQNASKGGSFEASLVKFLEERYLANEMIWTVYNGGASSDDTSMFHEASRKIWSVGLPDALDRLEGLIRDNGPFMMGDQVVCWTPS